MDQATTVLLEQQSEESRKREEQLVAGGAPSAMARRLAGAFGRELSDERAAKVGAALHQSLSPLYGAAAAVLAGRRMSPLAAAMVAGTAGFALVDEGLNTALGITPPPRAYPVESHIRGVVGHLTFALATGGMLSAAKKIGAIGAVRS